MDADLGLAVEIKFFESYFLAFSPTANQCTQKKTNLETERACKILSLSLSHGNIYPLSTKWNADFHPLQKALHLPMCVSVCVCVGLSVPLQPGVTDFSKTFGFNPNQNGSHS